jgi:DNA-binding CsgD family transcriptional regulator
MSLLGRLEVRGGTVEDGGIARFAARLAGARSPGEAVAHTIDAAGALAGSPVTGVYLVTPGGFEHHSRGASDAAVDRYLAVSARGSGDPLLAHVIARQTAVHESMIYDDAGWDRHPLFEQAAAPAGLRHYMLAPLVMRGMVNGAIAFSRPARLGPFTCAELLVACALSTRLSIELSILEAEPRVLNERLTGREAAVSRMLVKGLTNAEIASALGISVDYVKKILKHLQEKLEATNRTELATLLLGYHG